MVHKPKHRVHSFRGLLIDGGQDKIDLERQNMNVAYRIIKFQIIPTDPGDALGEHIVKIYKELQSTVDNIINFTDDELLAAATLSTHSANLLLNQVIIFDNTLFSRDIYVTHNERSGSAECNYYFELEEVPLSAASLMQIKLGTARRNIGGSMGN